MHWVLACLLAFASTGLAQQTVGSRPYEMDWAGRTQDCTPPLIDFEDLTGWTVETENSVAAFERSREQQIWGEHVGKLTYRGEGNAPRVSLVPPQPIAIAAPFDAVTLWVWGNNWFGRDADTPSVSVSAVFSDAAGAEFTISFIAVRWKEWFLCHRRLSPEQIERVANGASFRRFEITNGRNKADRTIYLDNLAVFTEKFAPLEFAPRRQRGISMFPGQDVGANTGPGRLPFPTRPETILPANLTEKFTTTITGDGEAFVFTYAGADGRLTYRLEPKTGTWSDLSAEWEGRGQLIRPCMDGGVRFAVDGKAVLPEGFEHVGTEQQGDAVVSRWRVGAGGVSCDVTYTYRLWSKSLVIDTVATGGNVAEVRYGSAKGLENPRLVTNPYYTYGGSRPAVAVSGPPEAPLFLTGNTDWYLSNASEPWAENLARPAEVHFNGGTRYTPLTDGKRNDCYERFFITLSPRYEEVLPTIANPVSPWKHITGTKLWRAHGAGNRDTDRAYWKRCHRYGMREVVVTDHETMWRDGGESFTFRTKAAPGKGGDEGAAAYSRYMQDELGFTYGPYNNFTDFAPVNEYWTPDLINRTPDNQLQHAWTRCYAPKPARAVEFCELLSPINESKYHFSTAYCDVHTAVTPWSRVDYDPRVPGAGTFAAVYYSYGEIMLLQKDAWDGPVYSEGNNHFSYCGLTDGNYAQDQRYGPATNPWLVDFDLLKMHDLCCNFGMGNVEMFFGRDAGLGESRQEIDASIDRFFAAAVAFGHPGFLTFDGGYHHALRSYYMLQQLHSRYCLASPQSIRYVDAAGRLLDTSTAVASDAYRRSQIVTRYTDGTVTAVNGSLTERMKTSAHGRDIDLPPNGYLGWSEDGSIEVRSSDPDNHRCDYADTPAYLFVDGRGEFMRFAKAAGNGIGICRHLGEGEHEIIPYEGAECGFAIDIASAVALDYEGNELGEAEVRRARGLTYIMPVENAFSYIAQDGRTRSLTLRCDRDRVVAGETVTITGAQEHQARIPAESKAGARVWQQLEGAWIDFTVVPLADAVVTLDGNVLTAQLKSNLAGAAEFAVGVGEQLQKLDLQPGSPRAVAFDLGEPQHEAADLLVITLASGELSDTLEFGMSVTEGHRAIAPMPEKYTTGMALRGQNETPDFGFTRASVTPGERTCGGLSRACITMHPPWTGGVGYVFAEYEPITLPAAPPAAFRALVGKGDGSDPGDGILYKVVVVDDAGNETVVGSLVVTEHAWKQIEADLAAFAGKTVGLRIIADVGENDDSSGDWACWADMRIEALATQFIRTLDEDTMQYRREPGPYPLAGLAREDLRRAKQGWLRYDGIGLSGTGESYGSFAILNGVELGHMAPAGGREAEGVWEENCGVPLTPEAIASLDYRNVYELSNPNRDWFKVRRFWLELTLADGRKCSSLISTGAYTQPPNWPFAEGILVPHGKNITVDIWFER